MSIKYMIKIMQAYVDGKKIQYCDGNNWYDAKYPSWNWDKYEYRIKPKRDCVPFDTIEEALNSSHLLVTGNDGLTFHYTVGYNEDKVPFITICDYDYTFEEAFNLFVFCETNKPLGKEVTNERI